MALHMSGGSGSGGGSVTKAAVVATGLAASDIGAQPTLPINSTVLTAPGALPLNQLTQVNGSGGGFTQPMPAPTAVGQQIVVERVDNTPVNLVVLSGTFRGAVGTITLTLPFESVTFEAESLTSWHPIAGHKTLGSLDSRYVPTGQPPTWTSGTALTVGQNIAWGGVILQVSTAHTTVGTTPDLTKFRMAASYRPLPTIRDMGQLNPHGLKIRGMPIGGNVIIGNTGNGQFMGSGFSLSAIQSQLANIQALGCNTVRMSVGGWAQLNAGTVTLAQLLANFEQALNAAASAGLFIEIGGMCDPPNMPSLATGEAWCIAMAAQLDDYPNVVAIDLWNEVQNSANGTSDPTATVIQQATGLMGAARTATTKPLTFSRYAGSAAYVQETGWISLLTSLNVDYWDIHPYYGTIGSSDAAGNITVTDLAPLIATGLPVLFGEVGDNTNNQATNAAYVTRLNAIRALIEQPWCAGAVAFDLYDYSSATYGFFNAGGSERTAVTYPLRTWPKRAVYQIDSTTHVAPSASETALTTALTAVPNVLLGLTNSNATAGSGDPHVQVVAEFVGASVGDTLNVSLVDANTSATYSTGTATVVSTPSSAGGGTYVDSSGNSRTLTANTGITSVSSPVSGDTNAAEGDGSTGYLSTGSATPTTYGIGGTNPFTIEGWVQRRRTAKQEAIFGAFTSSGARAFALVINTANTVQAYAWNSSSASVSATTAATTDTASAHHVALVFDGSYVYVAINGTVTRSPSTLSSGVNSGFAQAILMLADNNGAANVPGEFSNAILDEVRISNVARYTANFTPPTGPFTTDANTTGLYHLDTLIPGAAGTAATTKIETTPLYIPPGPIAAQVQVQNATGARGTLYTLRTRTRYSG